MIAFAIYTAVFLVLYEMWKRDNAKHSCLYCGKYRNHESHCPYRMIDKEVP